MAQAVYNLLNETLYAGSLDGAGNEQAADNCIHTDFISNIQSMATATVAAQAYSCKDWDGSPDGSEDLAIPSAYSADDLATRNPLYEIEYYWFTSENTIYTINPVTGDEEYVVNDSRGGHAWRNGYVLVVKSKNKSVSEEPIVVKGFQNVAYTGGASSSQTITTAYAVSGENVYYTENGENKSISFAELCMGILYIDSSSIEPPYYGSVNYSFDLKGVRESEIVDLDAAFQLYLSNSTPYHIMYDYRWETSISYPWQDGNYPLRLVLRNENQLDFSSPLRSGFIVTATLTMGGSEDAWALDSGSDLMRPELPEPIDEYYVVPNSDGAPYYGYPASYWQIKQRKLTNIFLPEELKVVVYEAGRPDQISVYDISEPQDGFQHNGMAILMPIECITTKEDAGRWDLTLVHPLDDYNKWTYLKGQNILKVNGQLYRIDEIEIYSDANESYITAHAKHISYDLYDKFVDEVKGELASGSAYVSAIIDRAETFLPWHHPEPNEYVFDISSNITGTIPTDVKDQTVIGALFGDDNSLASRFGGQVYRDNFHMSINTAMENAPAFPAFQLRYGTDLTKLSYKIDFSNWVTELICRDNLGTEWAVSYTGSEWIYNNQKTRIVHFTYDPDTPDPYANLVRDGTAYWKTVNTPTVSIEVSVANLKNDPKYADFVNLQNLDVGYIGTIFMEQLNINIDLKIVSIKRDELTGEALQVVLGSARGSFVRSPVMSQTIVGNGTILGKQELEMQAMKNQMEDLTLKQMRTWGGMKNYSWAAVKEFKWVVQ